MNGDGKADLVVASDSAVIGNHAANVLINNGDGTFTLGFSQSLTGSVTSMAAADVNSDGATDVAVTLYNAGGLNYVAVLLNGGNAFAAPAYYEADPNPGAMAAADLNGDNLPDLAVPNEGGSDLAVRLNLGNGVFGAKTYYPTSMSPKSAVAADLNGDGKLDLAVASQTALNVLLNIGNGKFGAKIDYPAGPYAMMVATDVNSDGKIDLVGPTVAARNAVSVMINSGNGIFNIERRYRAGAGVSSLTASDLNGDARPDLVVTNADSNTVSVLLGACLP
jgi:hypothetical protein